ncbi:MAG: nucleotidyltransferase family protein, partial [Steroidobacteraceae bacterium]
MHPLIDSNRAEISKLCRLHGVRRLEVFGSILRGDFDPERSDVDIVVEFDANVS